MAKTTDPMVAETERVYAEYQAAEAAHNADPTDRVAEGRFYRAQVAVAEIRQAWHEIGLACGTRSEGFVTVVHNTDEVPSLINKET